MTFRRPALAGRQVIATSVVEPVVLSWRVRITLGYGPGLEQLQPRPAPTPIS